MRDTGRGEILTVEVDGVLLRIANIYGITCGHTSEEAAGGIGGTWHTHGTQFTENQQEGLHLRMPICFTNGKMMPSGESRRSHGALTAKDDPGNGKEASAEDNIPKDHECKGTVRRKVRGTLQ